MFVCGVVFVNVHGYVVVCTCALVCAFMCVSALRMVDTNLQIYLQNMCLHVSVITQAQNNIHTVLAISFPATCLQLTQCDVFIMRAQE